MTITRVIRDPTPVMCRRVNDDHEAITQAWLELTQNLGSLRGRRLFGVFAPGTGEYRVCAQIWPGDDPQHLRLDAGTIAGGRYLRARIRRTSPDIYTSIPSIFAEMETHTHRDPNRPIVEFYRSHDTIDLLLPVQTDTQLQSDNPSNEGAAELSISARALSTWPRAWSGLRWFWVRRSRWSAGGSARAR